MTGPPAAARAPRRSRHVAALVLVLAAGIGLSIALARSGGSRPNGSVASVTAAQAARYRAIDGLLRTRSQAIMTRGRAAFMASIDPAAKRFRRAEGRMFAHLANVPLASWSYDLAPTARRRPPDAAAYHAEVWSPSYVVLHYRLAGFDSQPTSLRQYPTFVRRHGRWYLASLSDYARRGLVSATDLWDYGPVTVRRSRQVLVLGTPSQRATMAEVARVAQAAIGQVTTVWGSGWARRAVILVPASPREMTLIDGYDGSVANIAALTSAEVSTSAGQPAPVGDRITINPANWPRISAVGKAVVVRHELTHVATRAVTGTQTPTWLSEGFADYVGFRFAAVPVRVAAAELERLVRSGKAPVSLPADRAFTSSDPRLAASYESAWLACRYIAARFGEQTLVRFYRAVGTSPYGARVALRRALATVLRLTPAQFTAHWRRYVRAELA